MAVLILKLVTDVMWYLAVLFPVIASVPPLFRLLFLLVPAAWSIWLIGSWRKKDMAGGVQDALLLEGKILIAAFFVELVALGVSGWQRQCGGFAVMFLFSGILLLRVSRISEAEQSKARFLGLNGLYLFSAAAGAVILSLRPVREGILSLAGGIYQYLILPVLLIVLDLLMLVFQVLRPLFPEYGPQESSEWTAVTNLSAEMEFGRAETVGMPLFFKVLGILLAVGIAYWLLRYLYKRFSDVGDYASRNNAGRTVRSSLAVQGKRETGEGLFGGERNVRYYYRKFLKLCRERGVMPGGILTSLAVHESAVSVWPEEELLKLRELYRRARYGDGRESKEEKAQARALYRKLKGEEKEK